MLLFGSFDIFFLVFVDKAVDFRVSLIISHAFMVICFFFLYVFYIDESNI